MIDASSFVILSLDFVGSFGPHMKFRIIYSVSGNNVRWVFGGDCSESVGGL